MLKIILICLLSMFLVVSSRETFDSSMKSFSFAKKELKTISNKEQTIFTYSSAGSAVLTEQWFTSEYTKTQL